MAANVAGTDLDSLRERRLERATGDDLPPAPAVQRLTAPRSIGGSLPLDVRTPGEGRAELVPGVLFAPPHLRGVQRGSEGERQSASYAATNLTTTPTDPATTTTTGENAPDAGFLAGVEAMLSDGAGAPAPSRFSATPDDATYDFDEYVFLRSTDDPIARDYAGPGASQVIPTDPRFQRFLAAAQAGIAGFVENASLAVYPAPPQMGLLISGVSQTLTSWWVSVCAVRAFNRFGRYGRTAVEQQLPGYAAETFYGEALRMALWMTAIDEVRGYLAGNGDSAALGKLLTVAFWEQVLTAVFTQSFDDSWIVDPAAPVGDYPFDPFPADEVLFGVRVVHRQTWHLLGYGRGELVKTIPLGPRESQKVSHKIQRRTRSTRTTEEATSSETSAETSNTTKDTSEVVAEASSKLNAHAEAEVSGGYAPFFQAKVSAGLGVELGSSARATKTRLDELMEKTASRMKRDTKITVSTEREDTFEATRSSELTNPNDEIAVTYLYHRLQQRFWVSTEIAEVHSVVFVPEPLPDWGDIDEDWVRAHGELIAGALLDGSFAPVLAAIRREPPNLAYTAGTLFESAAQAGISAAQGYAGLRDGGAMPDLLASGQQYFERDFERRNSLAMEQARRRYQSQALLTHIRRNVLHYMRAIWAREDYDQRMQRLGRMRVPTSWYFVPRATVPGGANASPLEVEGVFMPDASSARPLTDVIDPIGPIGFLFNCAIYRLKDDPRLANLNQALAYLRAGYSRFRVTVTTSAGAGVTLRQAVAHAPRSFSADYTLTFRTNRGKWLIPRAGLAEGDWFEVKVLPDGSLDALGLRIWLDGTPVNQATITLRVRATADLEDPHLRLVALLNPLPAAADEAQVFTDALLREMAALLAGLVPTGAGALAWADLTEAQRAVFRAHYHLFLMLRETGRLVTLDTANLVLDLEISRSPALEQFKRLHRYLDVLKEYEEMRRRALDNRRREELIAKGIFGDPDIERVTLVGARDDIKDVIAVTDGPDE